MSAQYKDKSTWKRILFVAVFAAIFHITVFVTFAVVIAQCLFKIFTGSSNNQLLNFSLNLNAYIREILTYITFNSDVMPFPFNDFPQEGVVIEGEVTSS